MRPSRADYNSPRGPASRTVVLLDTNVIIEAVRTHCWNAITGGFRVETVEECRAEALNGDTTRRGYIEVTDAHLARLGKVHLVPDVAQAGFALAYEGAGAMDGGERALFAHAFARAQDDDEIWYVSSPDKASVRAAVALGLGDKMVSLETLARTVGARPKPCLEAHHGERWLANCYPSSTTASRRACAAFPAPRGS